MITIVVTRRGAELPRTPEVLRRVQAELTVKPFSPQNPFTRPFAVYADAPHALVTPLHWARAAFPDATWVDRRPEPARAHLEFRGALREDLQQPAAVAAVLQSLRDTGGAVLCAKVGQGKTTMALNVASRLGVKTLVLVHTSTLKEQWKERIAQFLPGARVTEVQGAKSDTSGDVVVAMIQTLMRRQIAFDDVGCSIHDESHHAPAECFSKVLFGLNARYTIGLTATPRRKDRLERLITWFLGPIAFTTSRTAATSTEVRVVTYTGPRYAEAPPTNRRGDTDFTAIVSAIADDEQRTRRVVEEAAAAVRGGRDVLVLSHRRAHCLRVCEVLRARGVDAATYLGGDKAVPTSRVIVATYALTSEGFDCPRLSALVLATPASDVEQACGRVMRGQAAADALIVDIVDQWGPCFAQAAKRRAFYRRNGFTVTGAPRQTHDEAPAAAYAFVD